jgi:hypothetical protein
VLSLPQDAGRFCNCVGYQLSCRLPVAVTPPSLTPFLNTRRLPPGPSRLSPAHLFESQSIPRNAGGCCHELSYCSPQGTIPQVLLQQRAGQC